MQKPIDELTELSRRYNNVSMLVMDADAFERFFGKIYAAVNLFRTQAHTTDESAQLVSSGCQLLELAIEHHRHQNAFATENAVKVFEHIVQQLLDILRIDLKVNETSYQEARTTRLKLNALKACGILPPGHSENHSRGRFSRADESKSEEVEALRFAQENLSEFTQFVYYLGERHEYIPDPFSQPPLSTWLSLYERVWPLTGAKMIECEKRPSA